jgi:hypothetical protein
MSKTGGVRNNRRYSRITANRQAHMPFEDTFRSLLSNNLLNDCHTFLALVCLYLTLKWGVSQHPANVVLPFLVLYPQPTQIRTLVQSKWFGSFRIFRCIFTVTPRTNFISAAMILYLLRSSLSRFHHRTTYTFLLRYSLSVNDLLLEIDSVCILSPYHTKK